MFKENEREDEVTNSVLHRVVNFFSRCRSVFVIPTLLSCLTLFTLLFTSPTLALSPEPRLQNEAQEKRAMNLFLEVRCLVCEGQVIENSDNEFSFAMRQLIRKKITENKSDEEIRQELRKEFGDDILTKPKNKILWILPIIFATLLILLHSYRLR